jgi:hypothetical protein
MKDGARSKEMPMILTRGFAAAVALAAALALRPGFAGAKPITLIQTKKPTTNTAATAPHHAASPAFAHATLSVTAKSKSVPGGLGHSRP